MLKIFQKADEKNERIFWFWRFYQTCGRFLILAAFDLRIRLGSGHDLPGGAFGLAKQSKAYGREEQGADRRSDLDGRLGAV